MAFRITPVVRMAFRSTPVARSALKKWAYNAAGFNKYGLYRDDVLYEAFDDSGNEPCGDVTEALRRLPRHVVDERNYRLIRAMQLCINKKVLPKDEWIRYEDDELYLSPIVDQVRKERLEREKWESEY